MLPIEPVIDDIKRQLGTDNIKLLESNHEELESDKPTDATAERLHNGRSGDQGSRSTNGVSDLINGEPEEPSDSQGLDRSYPKTEQISELDDESISDIADSTTQDDQVYKSDQKEKDNLDEKTTLLAETATTLRTSIPDDHRSPIHSTETNRAPNSSEVLAKPESSHHLIPSSNPLDDIVSLEPATNINPPLSFGLSIPVTTLDYRRETVDLERGSMNAGSSRSKFPIYLKRRSHHRAPRPVPWRIVILPYMLWVRLETLILRIEYRRFRPGVLGRRTALSWYRPIRFISLPSHPGRVNGSFQTIFIKDIRIALYYVIFALCGFTNFILSFSYFTLCFPMVLLVWYRHRDVLEHEKALRRQRLKSCRMLGHLPFEFTDDRLSGMMAEEEEALERMRGSVEMESLSETEIQRIHIWQLLTREERALRAELHSSSPTYLS